MEGALKDLLEGFWGYWKGFQGPRAQLAVAPDGNDGFVSPGIIKAILREY